MHAQNLLADLETSPLDESGSIAKHGLRFSPDLETRYRAHRIKTNATATQVGMAVGLFFMVLLLVLDAVAKINTYSPEARSIIAWILVPEMLFASLLSFLPRMQRYLAWISAFNLTFIAGVFIVVLWLTQSASPDTSAPYTYEVILFVSLFGFLFSGLPFRHAALVSLATTAAFAITQSSAGIDTRSLYLSTFFLLCANAFGIFCFLVIDHLLRREFLACETLNHLAERDPLTNALNRRAMECQLRKIWGQASRDEKSVGIMLIDIDNFKKINDVQGHAYGDQLLIKFARMMESIAQRPLDLSARYGGDEFVLFLYDVTESSLQECIDKLQELVRSSGENFTVSVGATLCVARPSVRIDDVLQRADSHLFQSKKLGRNRATIGE